MSTLMTSKGAITHSDLSSPEFWKEVAASGKGEKVNRKCMTAQCWDRAAEDYDDLESCRDYLSQVESVVTILGEYGAVRPGSSVIDIACGTGTYAVRFAPNAGEILCVDISSRMLQRLEAKKEEMGLGNIKCIQADWHSFSTDRKFDLVFCSMSPLLRSMDNVDRFLELSDRFAAFVTWAGVRENSALNELGTKILGRKPGRHTSDMNIIFNYLYAKGLAPDLHFFRGCWEKRRSVEKQIKNLVWRLEMYRPLDESEKELVADYVRQRSEDGMMSVVSRVRTVLMVVDKEAEEFRCQATGPLG